MPPHSLRRVSALVPLTSLALLGLTASTAWAAPKLRYATTQRGDFALIGNTLAADCANGVPAAAPGSTKTCGGGAPTHADSPDIYWRSDDPQDGLARAQANISAGQSRSTAVLSLPAGAAVTKGFLYWSGAGIGAGANIPADPTATLERPSVFSLEVTSVAGIPLSAPATVDCPTARAFAAWVEGGMLPAIGNLGGGVDRIEMASSYSCRPRNNVKGNKVSEHGRGAALDVASGTMLPAHFRLSIKTDGFVARCRMIWNDGCRVGIAFD